MPVGSPFASLARMPEQAQRSISQSVVAVQVQTFRHTVRNDPDGGSAKRYDNWLAECNAVASAAWQATAWVTENESCAPLPLAIK